MLYNVSIMKIEKRIDNVPQEKLGKVVEDLSREFSNVTVKLVHVGNGEVNVTYAIEKT